ncbi:MAG: hypothetical protein M0P31_06815 [Solirubrobacteraceae bacterium]|nr:hypothetical protein [Solirubrobacteraceae bacterium]
MNASSDGWAPPRTAVRNAGRGPSRPRRADDRLDVAATVEDALRLAREVRDAARTRPIVCLSTRAGEDRPALDPRDVREIAGRDVLLRAVRTGPASRALAEELPPRLGVFGGAARVWWPGVDDDADPRAHPLVMDRTGRYGRRSLEILATGIRQGPPTVGRDDGRRRERDERPHDREPTTPARLVALPGGGAGAGDGSPDPGRGRGRDDGRGTDDGALRRERDEARAEVRRLRERLAAVRLDAMQDAPAGSPASTTGPRGPRPATDAQVARLDVPAAVLREPERVVHLEIVAAWLARDQADGRRGWPMGALAIGRAFVPTLERVTAPDERRAVTVVAARVASGRPGEVDDVDLRADVDAAGQHESRDDGAAAWSCRVPGLSPPRRLRWWTREDGAVELRDVVRVDEG